MAVWGVILSGCRSDGNGPRCSRFRSDGHGIAIITNDIATVIDAAASCPARTILNPLKLAVGQDGSWHEADEQKNEQHPLKGHGNPPSLVDVS